MTAYYNEIDPKAAAWLRELIKQGHIADGVVDERSIEDVRPQDLSEFTQCHFFAGIGVWSYALRRAGYPDDMPVWTGSCPCQPFSAAGKGGGFSDERHLWPSFFHLIESCRPVLVMGEQVASKDGLSWLDLVQTDLEGTGYAFGALDSCAAGIGAPHIRQRLYWVGDAEGIGHLGRKIRNENSSQQEIERCRAIEGLRFSGSTGLIVSSLMADANANGRDEGLQQNEGRFAERIRCSDELDGLGNSDNARPQEHGQLGQLHSGKPDRENPRRFDLNPSVPCGVEHSDLPGCDGRPRGGEQSFHNEYSGQIPHDATGPTNGFWRNADWLFCRDGKWRAVEPGTFPLVNGTPARVGRLRGYGNAINAEQATENIKALMGVLGI